MTLKLIQINSTSHRYFKQVRQLYEEAFPPDEKRSPDVQKKLLQRKEYHFEVVTVKDGFAGFILWWDFAELCFIEHIATLSELRGQGIGKEILENFIQQHPKTILLEVELPNSEINQRRIAFYQRLGFHFNDWEYVQPPLYEGGKEVELRLMSYPGAISSNFVSCFIKEYHKEIYA
ncbi:GNAT family N-acetyltransferase [Methanolobus sp. ZRKC2]|uniref:GNAT family N-acetyltransferase n=1 Tax=Methanolobus sp. ZRKC2 TaxID=3125783 RepID=UPI00324EE222